MDGSLIVFGEQAAVPVCLVCGHATRVHAAQAPHPCTADECACTSLVAIADPAAPDPQCEYCSHPLSDHGPTAGSCTVAMKIEGADVYPVCPCKRHRLNSKNPAALRALYERSVKVLLGQVPPAMEPRRMGRGAMRAALGRPPVQDEEIRKIVNEYIEKTVEELGGMEALTAGQQAMLLGQRVSLEVMLMCEKEIAQKNAIIDASGDPLKTLRTLGSFVTYFRHGQVALGLARARRPKQDQSIADVVAEYQKAKEAGG